MYRKSETCVCDLCQHDIADATYPELALPLTLAEKIQVRCVA